MTGGLKRLTQLAEVVDLAVEDHRDPPVLVADRLMSGRDIDDAQPPHGERDARLHEHPLIVGPAMANRLAHPVRERASRFGIERRPDRRRLDESCDAAHKAMVSRRTADRGPEGPCALREDGKAS